MGSLGRRRLASSSRVRHKPRCPVFRTFASDGWSLGFHPLGVMTTHGGVGLLGLYRIVVRAEARADWSRDVSSDLVDVFLLSLVAMFNPTLLAATTVMLLMPNPKRLMLGYLLGRSKEVQL